MAILFFSLALFFLIFATLFISGKGAAFIIGYNQEKASKSDEKALLTFIGTYSYGLAAGLFMLGISYLFHMQALFIIFMILLTGHLLFGIIYLLTDPRFSK
jgi:hypothetical protein